MGALIRPRGCSKANEAHWKSPEGKDSRVTPSHHGENHSLESAAVSRKGNPGDMPDTQPKPEPCAVPAAGHMWLGLPGTGEQAWPLPATQPPLPGSPPQGVWQAPTSPPPLSHLSPGRCPLLLLRQLGRHQLVQLLHGQACHGPPSRLDLLQYVGELGPAWTAAC